MFNNLICLFIQPSGLDTLPHLPNHMWMFYKSKKQTFLALKLIQCVAHNECNSKGLIKCMALSYGTSKKMASILK